MSREPRTRASTGTPPRPTSRRPSGRPSAGGPPNSYRYVKRQEKEQHYQRLTLIGGGLIVALVGILLGIGWYQDYVSPYRQTVITVGNRRATMSYYITRVKQLLPQFVNSDREVVIAAVPEATREQLENEFTVLQRAPQSGATATEQEIDAAMATQLGIGASSPAARAALESALTDKLGKTGLTLAQYREQIRGQLLATQVQAKLAAEYPRVGPAAQYEEILMNDQATAKKLLDRLNGGEGWEAIVAEVHNSPAAGTVAQFEFQPRLQIDEKLVGSLFDLSPGEHTDVIQTGDGKFTIARLINKDDQHPISDDQVKAITPKLFSAWLDDQKKLLPVRISLTDDQKLFAMAHSGYVPKPPGKQAPGPQTAPGQQPAQVNPASLPPGISTPPGGLVPPVVPPAGGTQGP